MRLIRFRCAGRNLKGRLNEDGTASPLLNSAPDDPYFPLELAFGPERLPVERLLAPIVPADILGIGLNYREHAQEGKSEPPPVPMLFIKAGNTLSGPGISSRCRACRNRSITKANWRW